MIKLRVITPSDLKFSHLIMHFLRSGEGKVVAIKSVLRSTYGSNSSFLAGWQIVLMNVLLVNTHHVTLIHFQVTHVTESGSALVVSW